MLVLFKIYSFSIKTLRDIFLPLLLVLEAPMKLNICNAMHCSTTL
jgi:hypothetical protein